MSSQATSLPDLEFHAITAERWQDLEKLFGKNGAYGNCRCMWWRTTRSEKRPIMRYFILDTANTSSKEYV